MDVREIIENALQEASVEYEVVGDGQVVANLPGTRRLKTACWLTVGEHALTVEAFVVRKPDENVEQVYRY
ncbi:MAG TPA: YbjN domain-containing protein, partial [Mycobacterium sp.]|nr:YbjN domain-containing protein [Mycobacterium sp.]